MESSIDIYHFAGAEWQCVSCNCCNRLADILWSAPSLDRRHPFGDERVRLLSEVRLQLVAQVLLGLSGAEEGAQPRAQAVQGEHGQAFRSSERETRIT